MSLTDMHTTGVSSDLVRRLRDCDNAALGELFTLYRERLRQFVHVHLDRRLARRVDVDDVLQDAWVDAEKRLAHFSRLAGNASPYVWLRQVTLQTLHDTHRRHLRTQARDISREQATPMHGTQATLQSMAHVLVGTLTSPSQVLQRAEAFAQVQTALEQMGDTDRDVLVLRHFEELTNVETAEVLGIATGAASLRYIRALQRLQQLMMHSSNTEEAGG